MKALVASLLVVATMAIAAPAPASALGIHIGPRGVGVRVGHPHRHFFNRGPIVHRGWHRWHRY